MGGFGRLARIVRIGRVGIRIDVRGLASLYTGHLSAHEVMAIGQLQIGDDMRDALDALDAMFAGPRPWLGDMF